MAAGPARHTEGYGTAVGHTAVPLLPLQSQCGRHRAPRSARRCGCHSSPRSCEALSAARTGRAGRLAHSSSRSCTRAAGLSRLGSLADACSLGARPAPAFSSHRPQFLVALAPAGPSLRLRVKATWPTSASCSQLCVDSPSLSSSARSSLSLSFPWGFPCRAFWWMRWCRTRLCFRVKVRSQVWHLYGLSPGGEKCQHQSTARLFTWSGKRDRRAPSQPFLPLCTPAGPGDTRGPLQRMGRSAPASGDSSAPRSWANRGRGRATAVQGRWG